MFHILGFLFILIIAILIIGLSIVGTVIRSVFGLKKRGSASGRSNGNGGGYAYNSNSGNHQSNSSQNGSAAPEESDIHSKRKKLFSKDEGEYVDFEEVKE